MISSAPGAPLTITVSWTARNCDGKGPEKGGVQFVKSESSIRTTAFVGNYFPRKCGIAMFTSAVARPSLLMSDQHSIKFQNHDRRSENGNKNAILAIVSGGSFPGLAFSRALRLPRSPRNVSP